MKKLICILLIVSFNLIGVLNAQDNTNCTTCNNASPFGDKLFKSRVGLNNIAIGAYSFAGGENSQSGGIRSFAFGNEVSSSGINSVSFGANSRSTGNGSFAFGKEANSLSTGTFAIGSRVTARYALSFAIGNGPSKGVLINNQMETMVIGFNSVNPTLFISRSPNESEPYELTGKIGIGNITNPQAKLHLLADEGEEATIFIQPHNWEMESATLKLGSDKSFISANSHTGMEFISEKSFLFNGEFVGINTDKPEHVLHVNGNTFTVELTLYNEKDPPNDGDILYTNEKGQTRWGAPPIGGGGSSLWDENGNDIFFNSGNVGIGTINTYGYELAVQGKIITEEVMVKHPVNWPDYVFHNNYKLTDLKELEKFVTQNHHLPGIPSEREVSENGIELAKMNGLLLKKIEELTLYLIEQQKLLEKQNLDILELQSKFKTQ
jgi:hypothetical protein